MLSDRVPVCALFILFRFIFLSIHLFSMACALACSLAQLARARPAPPLTTADSTQQWKPQSAELRARDLLALIFQYLPHVCVFVAATVCKSWLHAAHTRRNNKVIWFRR